MNLSRRGVCSQDYAGGGGMECIPHIASRVMLRNVEQFKVRLVVFDLPRAEHLKAHIGPDLRDLAQRLVGWVNATHWSRAPWQGHVNFARFKAVSQFALSDQFFAP